MLDVEEVKLAFYTGPGCHLCDLASNVLAQTHQAPLLDITKCNIRDDANLYHLYAVRIPVIKRMDTGAELGWPFDVEEAESFLS